MLMFHEPDGQLKLDPYVVATAFDLTPGEARVAVAAADGLSPESIASRHAVSIHTVRTQLRAVFAKTGTSRQAELVSLLASLPMAALGLGSE
jgi:DNA-binding CsgD family transcriptional regulator